MRFPTKIDRYIFRQFIGTFVFMIGLIMAIIIVIDFAEKMDDFIKAGDKLTLKMVVIDYYLNFVIFFGTLLSPLIIFLSVIFISSVMTQRTELVAILSSGVSFYRVLMPYIVVAVFLTGVSFVLNAYTVPIANQKRITFEETYLKNQRPMADVNIHVKIGTDKTDGHETFFYLYRFNQLDSTGRRFTLRKIQNGELVTRIDAPKVTYTPEGTWKIEKAWTRYIEADQERLTYRNTIDTTFLLSPEDIYVQDMPAERIPLNQLDDKIAIFRMRGSEFLDALLIEWHERFANPLAIIVLTIIGFAVSTKKRRGGTPLMIGIGLALAFSYIGAILVAQFVLPKSVSPEVKGWIANVIYATLSLILIRFAPK